MNRRPRVEAAAPVALATLAVFVACGGSVGQQSPGMADAAVTSDSESGGCSMRAGCGTDSGASTDAFAADAPDDVGSCNATCSTAAGTVEAVSTPEQAYELLVGRWQVCEGGLSAFPGAPSNAIGIEYGPATIPGGGDMYYLVQGSSGPVRGQGFAYQLTYDVSSDGVLPPGVTAAVQLNMHPTPNSGFGGAVRYSPCPTELWVQGSPGGATLIPF